MKRDDLEHVLRAAGAITGVSTIRARLDEIDEETAIRISARLRGLF